MISERDFEIGADALAHVQAAVSTMDSPDCVRALICRVLALALEPLPADRRAQAASRLAEDACHLTEKLAA